MTTKSWQQSIKEAQEAGFGGSTDPAPPGPYLSEVVACKEKVDKNGNPYGNARLVIVEGPERGKKFFNNFGWNPQNPDQCEVFARHVAAFGIKDITVFPSFEAICTALIGKRAVATLKISEFRNMPRNEADGFAPAESSVPAPPSAPTGTSTPPPPPPPPPPAADGPPPSPFAS